VSPPQLVIRIVENDKTTVLKMDDPTRPQHWVVGRVSDCAVRIADTWVSAHHLVIRAAPMDGPNNTLSDGTPKTLWMLQDCGSTNGTYQAGILVGKRGHPSPWIVIEEDDKIMIGQSHLQFSFDGHFTAQGGDTDNAEGKQLTPTDIKPPVPAPEQPKAVSVWDIAALVLTGPKTTANWLWWLFLASVGSVVVLAIEWIKHQ
jgi:pSer/pThr/pTyr-binding forkhead associated (FHA) protein